tara:strand:+ start:1609 stop:1776 length:168 start_codon:yes stop_codon:yes gene_type:complete
MKPSMSKLDSLPPQKAIIIQKKSKSPKSTKKLYDFIDINLDKDFLKNYFQESKKK